MKVPTYKRQVESVSGAITPRLSAQVSPKVLGAQAEVIAEAGALLFKAGAEKLRIHAESQALKANQAMEIELRAIADDARTQDITVYTPADVQQKMQTVYEKYSKGLAIDPTTGKAYLRTSNSRQAFQVQGYDSYQKYLTEYRKTSNKAIAKQAEVNLIAAVDLEIKNAVDTDNKMEVRRAAIANLIDTSSMYDHKRQTMRQRGLLRYSASSNIFTAEKSAALIENSIEQIALGTAMSYMGDDSYAEVASDFVDGDLEARDEVLAFALAELSPIQREALNRKVMDYANKNIARLEAEQKKRDDEMKERLDKQYTQMINIADENPAQAKAMFEELKDNNYFEDIPKLNGTKRLLGMVDEDDRPTDDMDVIANLYRLADTKELTVDAVIRAQDRIPKSYKTFYTLALSMDDDGMRDGGQLISSAIGYDKFKDVKGIGDKANMFYQRALNEFTSWRVTPPAPNQPLSGGRGANYDQIILKAKEISERFGASLKAEVQNQFNKDYNMIVDSIEPVISMLNLPPLPTGTGDRKQEIMSWFQSLPNSVRQQEDVLLAWDIFRKFENEDVR
jgi:hypothetical protein